MEPTEFGEELEKASEAKEKFVGLTTAIVAVLLALATMMGHRSHTEEGIVQTRAADQWNYYQAKNVRAHMYEANADMADLIRGDASVAAKFRQRSEEQRSGAEQVRAQAEELEREVEKASARATRFDISEIFFEIGIVLCSVTLLTRIRVYWMIAIGTSLIGVICALTALSVR